MVLCPQIFPIRLWTYTVWTNITAAATNGTSPAAGNRGNNQPGYEPVGSNGTHNGNNRYSPTTMANNAANLSANQTYDIPVGR